MANSDCVYIKLRKHFDKQPIGFPATRSGAEIRILKHIFNPEEAEIATCLSYRFEPLNVIYARANHLVSSPGVLEKILDRVQKKGGVEVRMKSGQKTYCNSPLVVGMYEMQINRLTPGFVKDFNDYTANIKYGIEFLSTPLPQMRTIPIAKSLHPQHHVSTFDEISTLLDNAEPPFAILECICRKKKTIAGTPCQSTDRKETCLAVSHTAKMVLKCDAGRSISRDEALAIIEENQKEGLVLQPSNTEKAEFICSCCGCCCGMLSIHKKLPIPLDFWATNYIAVVDKTICVGCGKCEKACQVSAVSVDQQNEHAIVNLNRCIGCGVCIGGCPASAIALDKKEIETHPPQTREELFDIIMANKKGPFGKLKLTGKIITDAIKTGQTRLLK